MGLDVIQDWNCQHLDKNNGQMKKKFRKCVSVHCVFGDKLLPVCTRACSFTYASGGSFWRRTCDKYPVASEKLCATAITLHSRNWARWSVLYSEINTMNIALVKSSQVSGGGGEKKEKTTFGRAFLGCVPPVDGLRRRINLLIEVTFCPQCHIIRLFQTHLPIPRSPLSLLSCLLL